MTNFVQIYNSLNILYYFLTYSTTSFVKADTNLRHVPPFVFGFFQESCNELVVALTKEGGSGIDGTPALEV